LGSSTGRKKKTQTLRLLRGPKHQRKISSKVQGFVAGQRVEEPVLVPRKAWIRTGSPRSVSYFTTRLLGDAGTSTAKRS